MNLFQESIASRRHIYLWVFWCALHGFIFIIGYLKQKTDPSLSHLNRIGNSIYISRGAGLALGFDAALLLLPACRTLLVRTAPILTGKLGIPLGHPIAFHKAVAWTMLFFTIIHVAAHLVNFYTLEQLNVTTALSLHFKSWAGITGHLMLIVMTFMYVMARKSIRKANYELFYNTHQLSLFFIVLLLLHPSGCFVKTEDGTCKGYLTIRIILPGYFIYLAERIIKWRRSCREARIIDAIKHPGGVIELRLWVPWLKYRSGQYVYLNFPGVARYQWHPFTITSAPHQEFVSVHIRQCGDWTRAAAAVCGGGRELDPDSSTQLAYDEHSSSLSSVVTAVPIDEDDDDDNDDTDKRLFLPNSNPASKQTTFPVIRLDGPFGTLTSDIFSHDIAILVGGGIGVTPIASVLKDVLWRHQNNTTGRLKRVEFYWVCRNIDSFEWFRADLARLEGVSYKGFLRIYVHLTGTQDLGATTIISSSSPDPSPHAASISLLPLPPISNSASGTASPADSDPISRTRRGRPDFKKVFDEIEWAIQGGDFEHTQIETPSGRRNKVKVGVFVSGPRELRRKIRRNAADRSSKMIEFSVFS